MANSNKPNIYRVTRPDGTYVTGSSYMLAKVIPLSPRYIREIAKFQRVTREGYAVELVRAGHEFPAKPRDDMLKPVYVAENPDDDPIIGPAEEISALTGYTRQHIIRLSKDGARTKKGWTVRPATPEEEEESRRNG
jgi:hypothetical protein